MKGRNIMWLFTKDGLLMPAVAPLDKADSQYTEGKYDFQVRARMSEHLRMFMDKYMEPGTFHDEIQLTPHMDYNARFYTTHEAFAQAMSRAIMDIDYTKFKPQAYDHDYEKGFRPYYNVLNSIWADLLSLGKPGGMWGPKSEANPNGYDRALRYSSWGGSEGYTEGNFVGSTFFVDREPMWEDYGDVLPDGYVWEEDGYVSERDAEIETLLGELEGIPADQWEEYLTEREFELVKPLMEGWERQRKAQAKQIRKQYKKNKKNREYRLKVKNFH